MKRNNIRPFAISALTIIVAAALIASPITSARAQTGLSVTASAVIVPAQVAELGFLSNAIIREMDLQKGDAVKAGDTLAALNTPELEYAVTAAEAAYRSAQSYAELQYYRRVKKYNWKGKVYFETEPREVIQRGNALAARAKASLEVAQAILAQSTLAAPFDGTVIAFHTQAGELAQLGQPVLTLATLDQLQIETTDLSERDIAKIKIGQTANVFVDALGAEFSARVIAIAPRADTLGGDVIYKVTLAFDEQPVGLLWGMTAEVTISAE
jgi:RND family efflux transporter MFP subunit